MDDDNKVKVDDVEKKEEITKLAPFNPSSDRIQEIVLRMLSLTEQDVLFDLGCGDGRLLITAATTIPGLRCVGIEMDSVFTQRAWASLQSLSEANVRDRVDIRWGDAVKAAADVSTDQADETDETNDIPCTTTTISTTTTTTESLLLSSSSLEPDERRLMMREPSAAKESERGSAATLTEISTGSMMGRACTGLTLRKDATALYLYIVPKGIAILLPLLETLLEQRKREKRDFRIVSFMFKIPKIGDATAIDRTSKAECPVYLYEFQNSTKHPQ
jgi:hypothetical protein